MTREDPPEILAPAQEPQPQMEEDAVQPMDEEVKVKDSMEEDHARLTHGAVDEPSLRQGL